MQEEPFEKIFTDQKAVDPKELTAILESFVRINSETLEIFFTDEGYKLTVPQRIILFLLAKKVLKIAEKIEREETAPKEIFDATKIKKGSIDPAVKQLREKGWIIHLGTGYLVPNYQISKLRREFFKKEENGT